MVEEKKRGKGVKRDVEKDKRKRKKRRRKRQEKGGVEQEEKINIY